MEPPPSFVPGVGRLFFTVSEVRFPPETGPWARNCCPAPLPGPGVYEVRGRFIQNETHFHWRDTHNGYISFRRPNDVESHDARISDWELKETE